MANLNNLLFQAVKFEKSILAEGRKFLTYQQFFQNASLLKKGLYNCNIKRQERVILIAESSINWLIIDFAALSAGITTVPMFANASTETLEFQFDHCGATNIIVQNQEVLEKVLAIKNNFQNVFLIEKSKKFADVKTVDEIILQEKQKKAEGKNVSDANTSDANVSENDEILEEDLATIVYTSGTSGKPKGVVITYANLARQIMDISSSFHELSNCERAISILPLAHIFQRTITLFYISIGVNVHFVNDMQHVLNAMQEIKPTLITVVPRVLEKIHTRVLSQVQAKPKVVQKIILPILEYSSTHIIKNWAVKKILNAILFKKVLAVFGGEMKMVVSGGAKLNAREETFFINCGLNVLQGYGMTECCPVVSSNTNSAKKPFTVGKPFNSLEVKIVENGEICVRGESVFGGYLKQEKRNPQEFFHTGDCGTIDEHGFLTVTGRIKEQFKNANGKFVDPVRIENLLNSNGGIEASCVVAEGRPYTVAVVFTQVSKATVQKIVAEANKHLDHHAQIQYFHITAQKPTIENGVITPSLKLRRNEVMKKYAAEIEEMYKL